MFAVLLVAYSNGKLSYFSVLRWRDVIASRYSCSSMCCCNSVTRSAATRAVTLIVQHIIVSCATYLAELICENEELYLYPAPLYKSHITLGLKCAQALSLLAALYGFLGLCRAASIVQPRTSPFIKLFLYKCIYILSAVQGNVLLYLAFNRILPAVSDIEPVTRAVVWSNFATVTECTFAYFIAVRVYKVDDYALVQSHKPERAKTLDRVEKEAEFYRTTFEGPADGESPRRPATLEAVVKKTHSSDDISLSTPELELDSQNLLSLKLLGLNVKLPEEVEEKLSLSSLRKDSLRKEMIRRDSLLSADNSSRDTLKGLSSKSKFDLSSDEDIIPKTKSGKLKKDSRSFRSADAMMMEGPRQQHNVVTKTATLRRSDKSDGYSKLPHRDAAHDSDFEPKVSIVGGKVNISLSSKDLAKLCKSSASDLEDTASISLSIGKISSEEAPKENCEARTKNKMAGTGNKPEKFRVTFEETAGNSPQFHTRGDQVNSRYAGGEEISSRHSMQFVSCYNSDSEESENSVMSLTDPSQYVSKISLV